MKNNTSFTKSKTNYPFLKDSDPIRPDIFSSKLEQKFLFWYGRLFSVKEIEESSVLQWFFGATLFTFFVAFSSWIKSSRITVEAVAQNVHTCWPYFQSCGDWYFLSALPDGYSQTTLYMLFFGLMIFIVYLMWKRDWLFAHMLMAVLFVWEFLIIFVLSYSFNGNYDYYHIVLTFILLFLPLKLFFLKLIFVLLYFLAVTIKIHEGWILGTYFSALKTGLPLFPDSITPLITNIAIFMQVVGAWFLLGSNKLLQRVVLFYFVVFHLYSGILVGYRYPATVLPGLLILFGPMYTVTKVHFSKKSTVGWTLVILLFVFQFLSLIIPGDEKITLEANEYGLYMFEANHQCVSRATVYTNDGKQTTLEEEYIRALNRCNPYKTWFTLQQLCREIPEQFDRIEWQFDHSINGGPFYRIVDTKDVCALEYTILGHNEWIQTPKEGALIIGYPVENIYR